MLKQVPRRQKKTINNPPLEPSSFSEGLGSFMSSRARGGFIFSKSWAADMVNTIYAQKLCTAQYCFRCVFFNHCTNKNAKTGDKNV